MFFDLSHKEDIVCDSVISDNINAPQLSNEYSNFIFLSGRIISQTPRIAQRNMQDA